MVVESEWQTPEEEAGHIASVFRTQRMMNTTAQLDFSFSFNLRPWPREWWHPVWMGPLTSVKGIRIMSHRYTWNPSSGRKLLLNS